MAASMIDGLKLAPLFLGVLKHDRSGCETRRAAVQILKAFVSAWISALAGVFGAMLIGRLFDPHPFKPWVAVGIASGTAIAYAIRVWRQVPPERFAWLAGCFVGMGAMIGTWFSGLG